MKKGYWVLYVLIATIFITSLPNASAELVCGQNPNSLAGYGQVNISGVIYSCSNTADGLCPEDYEDFNNPAVFGDCSSCPDPDCTGAVSGTVYGSGGAYIERASVRSHPIKWDPLAPSLEKNATTNSIGAFSFSVTTGKYYMSASKDSYDTELKEVTILRNQNTVVNFNLLNGTCHDDCTNSYGRCNAACDGMQFNNGTANCNFYPGAAPLCNNRLKGTEVLFAPYNSTSAYFLECCEAAPLLKYYADVNVTAKGIKNLAKYEKIAKYNDVPVKIIVAYWPIVE